MGGMAHSITLEWCVIKQRSLMGLEELLIFLKILFMMDSLKMESFMDMLGLFLPFRNVFKVSLITDS
jgi:hypothetical protein